MNPTRQFESAAVTLHSWAHIKQQIQHHKSTGRQGQMKKKMPIDSNTVSKCISYHHLRKYYLQWNLSITHVRTHGTYKKKRILETNSHVYMFNTWILHFHDLIIEHSISLWVVLSIHPILADLLPHDLSLHLSFNISLALYLPFRESNRIEGRYQTSPHPEQSLLLKNCTQLMQRFPLN